MERALLFLTLVLCAVQPSGCESWTTASASVQTAPPFPTAQPRPSSSDEIVLVQLPEAQAWRSVKSSLGLNVLVLRPTTVPSRFTGEPVMIEYAYHAGTEPRYRVGYRAANGLINIAAGAVNSAAPTSAEDITLRGRTARFSTTAGWPELQITWDEGGVEYSIQARGISRAELLRIAEDLVAVP